MTHYLHDLMSVAWEARYVLGTMAGVTAIVCWFERRLTGRNK